MIKFETTAALTGSLLVAALAGITLGTSTVGAVNPIFFTEVPVHPRDRGAAVDPREIEARRLARQAAVYDEFYGWNEGSAALSLACAGCTRQAYVGGQIAGPSVPYFGSREEIAREDARRSREIDARYEARLAEEEARYAREAQIERYAHFAVAQESEGERQDESQGMGGPDEPVPAEEEIKEAAPAEPDE
jgi:hypothetical protein